MYARIAQFEGGDPSRFDEQAEAMKRQMSAASSGQLPEGAPAEVQTLMETVKRFVELVDRKTGASVGIVFTDTEDDMRVADEALNAMSPEEGGGRRTAVGIYEVLIDESFG